MALDGHEIGSHTMNHYDLTTLPWGNINEDSTLLYELYQSKIFIEQKIPTAKCISLNYPYTLHNPVVDSAASLFYENGRTLGQVPNDSSLSRWKNGMDYKQRLLNSIYQETLLMMIMMNFRVFCYGQLIRLKIINGE